VGASHWQLHDNTISMTIDSQASILARNSRVNYVASISSNTFWAFFFRDLGMQHLELKRAGFKLYVSNVPHLQFTKFCDWQVQYAVYHGPECAVGEWSPWGDCFCDAKLRSNVTERYRDVQKNGRQAMWCAPPELVEQRPCHCLGLGNTAAPGSTAAPTAVHTKKMQQVHRAGDLPSLKITLAISHTVLSAKVLLAIKAAFAGALGVGSEQLKVWAQPTATQQALAELSCSASCFRAAVNTLHSAGFLQYLEGRLSAAHPSLKGTRIGITITDPVEDAWQSDGSVKHRDHSQNVVHSQNTSRIKPQWIMIVLSVTILALHTFQSSNAGKTEAAVAAVNAAVAVGRAQEEMMPLRIKLPPAATRSELAQLRAEFSVTDADV
jgi:hypothetical protein